MALVETADGRWFAACASLWERPPRVSLIEDPPLIPPALDVSNTQQSGYLCRGEALSACQTWYETVELLGKWRRLAARAELYPERNAWYLEEIAHLAGDDTIHLHYGHSVQAVVQVRGNDGIQVIAATANSPDEAIEALYLRVYEWSKMLQAPTCTQPPID
jgi:hypothetical protein